MTYMVREWHHLNKKNASYLNERCVILKGERVEVEVVLGKLESSWIASTCT